MAAQAAQQPVGAHQLRRRLPDRGKDHPARPRELVGQQGGGEVVRAQDSVGLVDDEPVAADEVADPHVADPLQPLDLRDRLEEGRGVAAHVADHHLCARLVAGAGDRLGVGQGQGDRLLDEDVLAVPQGGDGGVGVVLVAGQDQDGVEVGAADQGAVVGVAGVGGRP